jgi:hypothetical protein
MLEIGGGLLCMHTSSVHGQYTSSVHGRCILCNASGDEYTTGIQSTLQHRDRSQGVSKKSILNKDSSNIPPVRETGIPQ